MAPQIKKNVFIFNKYYPSVKTSRLLRVLGIPEIIQQVRAMIKRGFLSCLLSSFYPLYLT